MTLEPRDDDDDDDDNQLDNALSQADLLRTPCRAVTEALSRAAAKAGLRSLCAVLESDGHRLDGDAWPALIGAVGAVPGYPTAISFGILKSKM